MAWIYLAELADSPWLWSPGSGQSPIVKSTDTLRGYCWPECQKDGCQLRPCGTTCEHLNLFHDRSTSYTADFRARTSARQAMDAAWTESEAAWCSRYFDLLGDLNPRSFSLKMCRGLGPVDVNEWSKNWPHSGMTVGGVLYPLSRWVLRSRASVGFLWPRLKASDASRGWRSVNKRGNPTLPSTIGGHPNPTWIEWLMGYPIGWTELKGWAMQWFQLKPGKRSADCPAFKGAVRQLNEKG